MPKYTTEVDGQSFDIEIHNGGGSARLNGDPIKLDPVWLTGSRENLHLLLDGRSYDFRIEKTDDALVVTYAGIRHECQVTDKRVADLRKRAGVSAQPTGKSTIKSPMPGLIVKILVTADQEVKRGDRLIVIEAMKMENDVKALRDGRVTKISVEEGSPVKGGQELLTIE